MPGPSLQPRARVTEHPPEDQQHDRDDDQDGDQQERRPPRFNPLVFGVIAATIQMAIFLWLIYG